MPMVAAKGPYVLLLKDDDMAENPRETDDCFGTMVCFHQRYRLGDEHNYGSPKDFLRRLVKQNVPAPELIAYVKEGKADGVKFEYNLSSRQWEVNTYSDFLKKWFTEAEFQAPTNGQESEISVALIENMNIRELESLAYENCCILPLYLYDHSIISISTGSFIGRAVHAEWDSGQVGWVYATKEAVIAEYGGDGLTPGNREKATKLMRGEVEYYDHYLCGNCYGFELYKDGVEEDSCWGFIGSPDELREEIESYLPADCWGIMNNLVYHPSVISIEDFLQEQADEWEVG